MLVRHVRTVGFRNASDPCRGVARLGDAAGLRAAGADIVVTSLDEVAIDALKQGRLKRCAP